MRTLFVTIDPCFPPVSGADLRNWQNANAALRYGPVMLVSLLPAWTSRTAPNGLAIADLSAPEQKRAAWTIDATLDIPKETHLRFVECATSFRADTVILEATALAPLANVARRVCRQLIVDMHNVESHLMRQAAPQSYWRRAVTAWDIAKRVKKLEELERVAAANAARIWVCSELERRRLMIVAPRTPRIDIVPNTVPRLELLPDVMPVRSSPVGLGPRMLFVGHLSYSPNVMAAHRLVEIASALRRNFPQTMLVLAGRNPSSEVQAMARHGFVDIRSNPDDVTALLREADLTVMPLDRGGGTRIKVLEAMAWGLPVVATSRAVDGLGLAAGRHYQLAGTNDEFLVAIIRLLSHPELCAAQCQAARVFALTDHGPEAFGRAFAAALRPISKQ